jgi:hypothetical protein
MRAVDPTAGQGLPDGTFSNKKIPIPVNFGGPWNGEGCIAIWSILRQFGIF